MDRLVYLFELDSRRNTVREIERGQRALFEELVVNGNRVVLSLNQLTDSEAFLAAVKDEKAYEHILTLFRAGRLRVSRFGAYRTASQCIQTAIEKCLRENSDAFLFSGVPVLCTDKELLGELAAVLRYSDPALLEERLASARTALAGADPAEREGLEREAERLAYLLRYVKMIFTLSMEPLAGNPPRGEKSRSFLEFYQLILSGCLDGDGELALLLPGARDCLERVRRTLEDRGEGTAPLNNRTNWVNELLLLPERDEVRLAEAVVDLCYNYTVEDSICGVSRHYRPEDPADFAAEFRCRLARYWSDHLAGVHVFHQADSDRPARYTVRLPGWATAARVVREKKADPGPERAAPYESGFERERKGWRRTLLKRMAARFGVGLFYILLFCVVQQGMTLVKERVLGAMMDIQLGAAAGAALDILGFGILGSILSNALRLPDILESVKNIGVGVRDAGRLLSAPRGAAYRRD